MLTKRQNLLETIKGGNPDRLVNQFEFFESPYVDPFNATNPYAEPGGEPLKDLWGVTWSWPEGTPGPFPLHDEEHVVIKDIPNWRDYVKAPSLDFPDELWAEAKAVYDSYDRNEIFVGPTMFPGIFEFTHCLIGMEDALMGFYEEPEAMHEIIEFFVDWECQYVELMAKHLQPDVIYHHDDWGSKLSTFLSPEMFDEFYLEPYKRLYKCYRDNGFELIIHHSDSYAANLVPFMIEMGIDIWQGAMKTNNLPELIEKYGSQISIMSGIDTADVDKPDWTQKDIEEAVRWAVENCGKLYFIPCQTQGGPISTYEGVYEALSAEIEKINKEVFVTI